MATTVQRSGERVRAIDGEHCRQQKGGERSGESQCADDGDLLDVAHKPRVAACHGGERRQIEDHESQHHHAVKNSFDHNGGETGADRHVLFFFST